MSFTLNFLMVIQKDFNPASHRSYLISKALAIHVYCVQSCETGNAFIQQIHVEGLPRASTSYTVVNSAEGPRPHLVPSTVCGHAGTEPTTWTLLLSHSDLTC